MTTLLPYPHPPIVSHTLLPYDHPPTLPTPSHVPHTLLPYDHPPTVSKSVVTAMRFTTDDKHLIKMSEKLRRKTLAQDVFDRS